LDRRDFLKVCGLSMISSPLLAKGDEYISKKDIPTFLSINIKLHKIQKVVGYGNFNIISFDEALMIAKRYSKIGAFTKAELDFIENIFYSDMTKYGFYGKKTVPFLTTKIDKKSVVKIPHTGHYLFQDNSVKIYKHMLKDVNNIYLTSGVRSVVKQMRLYFSKIYRCGGNITKATNSIAPIAYSYHSIGDFDVGKKGLGSKNFTEEFATTEEFYKIQKLKYVNIRYTKLNKDGIRYEPWHIKII
jgi:hypothetical protein